MPGAWPAGTIVISDAKRELFLSLGGGKAIEYPVAVPKWDKKWFGETRIVGKYVRPDWSPPASVKVDHPELPEVIPGGSPHNPMGARAMMLAKSEIAIHGTNAWMRKSVGTAASYGCIRMRNEDVTDLFARVSVGTPVVMVR
ncbi:MAG: L,D-transpeptidase [Hyphomicrobiales bacterium]|nr:L,D-transpeptidase [Hyphomicrobiales bacterium]MDE2017776.1 L,D-transpeptidase [Hyphomicrobiales bacterium]